MMAKQVIIFLLITLGFSLGQAIINQLRIQVIILWLVVTVAWFKKKVSDRLAGAALLLITLSLFLVGGGFDSAGPPLFADHPLFYYMTDNYVQNLRGGVNTFLDNETFAAGKKTLPPSIPSLFILPLLGITTTLTSYRLHLFASFLLPIIGIYYFLRKNNFSQKTSLLVSLLWFAFPHHDFLTGRFLAYASLGLSMFSLSYMNREENKKNIALIIFLTTFSTLFNAIIGSWTIIVAIIYSLVSRKKKFLITTASLMIILLLPSFISTSLETFDAGLMKEFYPFLFTFKDVVYNQYLKHCVTLVALAMISLVLHEQKKIYWPALVVSLMILFGGLFTNFLGQASLKYGAFLLRAALLLPVATLIQKTGGKMRKIISAYALFTIAFYTYYLFTCWYNPQQRLYQEVNGLFDLWKAERLNTTGILSYNPNYRFEKVLGAINALPPTPSSRILFENSFDREYGGYSPVLLPLLTNRSFIGEEYPLSSLFVKEVFADGLFLKKNISEWSEQEFQNALTKYNVKYVVAWSDEYKKYLSNSSLVLVNDTGFSKIYEYEQAPQSFIQPSGSIEWVSDKEFVITTNESRVNVSYYYQPEMKVFSEEPLEITEGEYDLIRILFNESGTHEVRMVYK